VQPTSQVATWKTRNQLAKLQPSRSVGKPLQPISEQSTALGGALQPLSKASTGCGNGLQLISDASTALAWIPEISQFEAICQRFLSRFRFDSPSNFVVFS
jgi:hypothetical protein